MMIPGFYQNFVSDLKVELDQQSAAELTLVLKLLTGNPDITEATSDGPTGRHIIRDKDDNSELIDKTVTRTGSRYVWSDT